MLQTFSPNHPRGNDIVTVKTTTLHFSTHTQTLPLITRTYKWGVRLETRSFPANTAQCCRWPHQRTISSLIGWPPTPPWSYSRPTTYSGTPWCLWKVSSWLLASESTFNLVSMCSLRFKKKACTGKIRRVELATFLRRVSYISFYIHHVILISVYSSVCTHCMYS